MKKLWVSTAVLLVLLSVVLIRLQQVGLGRLTKLEAYRPKSTSVHEALPASPAPAAVDSDALPREIADRLSETDNRNVAKIVQAFSAPIRFYGKVIDEKGQPVERATVYYSVTNQYFGKAVKYKGISDHDGLFSVQGIAGAGMYVNVAKDGYYGTEESGASFGYGVPSGKPPPSEHEPAIFTLRKMGITEPLVQISERPLRVPKTGAPVEISLQSGQAVAIGRGDMRIECWTQDEKKDTHGVYSWHCQISIPNGGLISRETELSFEAPTDGYVPSDDIAPPQDRWSSSVERQYFVRTQDNHFARVHLRVRAGSENYVVIESYLNPTPGSRNLEYDPAKRIIPK